MCEIALFVINSINAIPTVRSCGYPAVMTVFQNQSVELFLAQCEFVASPGSTLLVLGEARTARSLALETAVISLESLTAGENIAAALEKIRDTRGPLHPIAHGASANDVIVTVVAIAVHPTQ